MFPLFLIAFAIVQCTATSLPRFFVRDEELLKMSKILRDEDSNKAKPGQILINYQGHTQSGNQVDNAAKPLFTKVSKALLNKPSYKGFIGMMNNFYKEAGVPEPRVSREEEQRGISLFLRTILASKPWQILYKFLRKKHHPFAKDHVTFRNSIRHLWFDHYSRARGKADTSGFEHVFIGEEKHGEISGLHNWVRFYILERNATEKFDYKGFIVKRGDVMAALKFAWDKAFKRTGSLLIGTSPEYEMALYTMCFLSRRGKNPCQVWGDVLLKESLGKTALLHVEQQASVYDASVKYYRKTYDTRSVELDGCPLTVNSYAMIQNRKVYIGTVYPTAGKMTDTCARKNSFRA